MSNDPKAKWTGEMAAIGEELERWQAEHPDATMRDIELRVEQAMAQLGVQVMAGMAMARDTSAGAVEVRCPKCGGPTNRRGRRQRKLKGAHDESVVLTRQYVTCQQCGHGFFPLDRALGLIEGVGLLPCMHERVVWLGTEEPFAKAQEGMAVHHSLTLSAEQVRQRTEEAGRAYEDLQTEEPAGGGGSDASLALPERQMVCVDAAKVRVIGQGWCDAKTLTIGRVRADGSTTDCSYFSRMMECHAFAQAAHGEAVRRGLAFSLAVCAVMDGAEYNQLVVDVLRRDATRTLGVDFYHAVEHLAAAGRAVWGEDVAALTAWLEPIRHTLRHGSPETVLAQLSDWAAAHPAQAVAIDAELAYFTKRQDQIAYAAFEQQGWPLGSGAGESAHKTVLQARMKRAGMSWAAPNVNPMLALRNLTCSQRWRTDWERIPDYLCAQADAPAPDLAPAASSHLPASFTLRPAVSWRNQPVGRARYTPSV